MADAGRVSSTPRPSAHHAPRVSVVLYVHNGGEGLRRAIASILGQTVADLELCILDDGSTDQTPAVIAAFPDARIRSERQAARGPARLHETFNAAFAMARADLVAVANADDVWRPEKLARQLDAFAADPDLDVCFHDVSFMDADDRITPGGFRTNQPWVITRLDPAEFFSGDPIPNPTVMFRRAITRVIGLQEVGWVHDYQFWMKAALGRCTFLGLPDRLAVYRTAGGHSTSGANHARILAASLETIESMRLRHDLTDIFPDLAACEDGSASVAYAHLDLANRFLVNRQMDLAQWELEALLRIRPDCPAAMNNLGVCLAAAGATARATSLIEQAAATQRCPTAAGNAALLHGRAGQLLLTVADWSDPLPDLASRRGTGPRPVRASAPAAATLVAVAADADLQPAFDVLADCAAGRSLPLPVLFVTEDAASTAALSAYYDDVGVTDPGPGEAPAVEALEVLAGNHPSVVAAHLLTARHVVVPAGGPRATALRAAAGMQDAPGVAVAAAR